MRKKGGWIASFGVDATEKYNSYANGAYLNNQHVHEKDPVCTFGNTILAR